MEPGSTHLPSGFYPGWSSEQPRLRAPVQVGDNRWGEFGRAAFANPKMEVAAADLICLFLNQMPGLGWKDGKSWMGRWKKEPISPS